MNISLLSKFKNKLLMRDCHHEKSIITADEALLRKIHSCEEYIKVVQGELSKLRNDNIMLHQELLTRDYLMRRDFLRHRERPSCHSPKEKDMVSLGEVLSLDDLFDCLKQQAPAAFGIWRELLDVSAKEYEGYGVDSCSVPGHPMAELFKCFLAPYINGKILDIGCGPQPVPLYLQDVPLDDIYGMDPISNSDTHPFHFIKGVAEFLPFEDQQFDLVIAATSLDHVLLLDKAIIEVNRVLKGDGHFIVWICYVPGSAPYNPYREGISKIDEYHLFHFDEPWFLPLMERWFVTCEDFGFIEPNQSHFIVFRKKDCSLKDE